MSYVDDLPRPFFVLAPMDDVTDTVFRQVIAECASPNLFFTEFANTDGLQSEGRPKLLRKLRFSDKERPLIAQIWGKKPEDFYKTARQVADGTFARDFGLSAGINYSGVDLNMGCPNKSEVKSGTCSALINDRPLAKDIIRATKEGLDNKLPISVKTRLGFNEVDMSWIAFLLEQDINMLTIHGRTKKQMSKVPANWELIEEARRLRDKISPGTLIVGNGDVLSREQGNMLAEKHGLDGIMIGRGIFHDPFVFSKSSPWEKYTQKQKTELFKHHVELFMQTWENKERPIHTLNKFCKVYINGFSGAKEFRERLMFANETLDLINLLDGRP